VDANPVDSSVDLTSCQCREWCGFHIVIRLNQDLIFFVAMCKLEAAPPPCTNPCQATTVHCSFWCLSSCSSLGSKCRSIVVCKLSMHWFLRQVNQSGLAYDVSYSSIHVSHWRRGDPLAYCRLTVVTAASMLIASGC
jgi:hypothetical protein